LSIVFDLERTNQLSLLPDKDLVDLCHPIEPYQVTKSPFYLLFMLKLIKLLLYAVGDRNMTLQELMRWAEKLSSIEKRQLIEKITAEMASESAEINQPRPSLWGICADLGQAPSAEDIDKTRREAWGDFTAEDL
jgi:hypothetical protein